MSRRSIVWYWISFIAVIVLMVVYVERRDLYGRYLNYQKSKEEVQVLQGQLNAMEQEQRHLQDYVHDLDKDPVEVEAAIRRTQGLVRQGETVYRVELPLDAPSAK